MGSLGRLTVAPQAMVTLGPVMLPSVSAVVAKVALPDTPAAQVFLTAMLAWVSSTTFTLKVAVPADGLGQGVLAPTTVKKLLPSASPSLVKAATPTLTAPLPALDTWNESVKVPWALVTPLAVPPPWTSTTTKVPVASWTVTVWEPPGLTQGTPMVADPGDCADTVTADPSRRPNAPAEASARIPFLISPNLLQVRSLREALAHCARNATGCKGYSGLDREDAVLALHPGGLPGGVEGETGRQLGAQVGGGDHRVHDQVGGQPVEVDVLAVLALQPLDVGRSLRLGQLLDLVEVHGVDGGAGPHHRDHGRGQGQGGVRFEGRARHAVEAGPVGLAHDHRDLGDGGFGDRRDHLRSVPDDALALDGGPDHEARDVGQEEEGDVEGVAEPDETGRLVRRVDEEDAAL